jgi:para-nitrobenzyl esterase
MKLSSGVIFLLLAISGSAQNVPVVKTAGGYIRGETEKGIAVFKGIPYAQPPVGSLRYTAPAALNPWSDTLSATAFGSSSAQPAGSGISGTENCLYLNVYTPALDHGHRPVVVWVHGGSMTNGSGSDDYYQLPLGRPGVFVFR